MKSIVLAFVPVFILLAIVLVGCGQTGDLYLPGHNPHPPPKLLKRSTSANALSTPDDEPPAGSTDDNDTPR